MAERAAEIASLLLREGALRAADAEHRELRAELLGRADLFADVGDRLKAVGYRLVERLGHIGVAVDPATAVLSAGRNHMGLHAGHVRLICYLWVHLVYREYNDLRRDSEGGAPGQTGLFEDGLEGAEEAPFIAYTYVYNDFAETLSKSYFKSLLTALRRWRFVRTDERRDRIWADASLYTLVDLERMEDFVIDMARRIGAEDPAAAVVAIATGSAVEDSAGGDTP